MKAENPMLVPGQLIDDKYRIVRQLGHGGMGAVFEALHLRIKRRVAIKVIVDDRLGSHPEAMARFRREASLAGRIETQHIVQVLDTGEDPATRFPYIAMELLVGEDLDRLVGRLGPLPQSLALRIVAQALLGLAKAHEAGVIHRDIKPGNIFLAARDAGEYVVKLLDFGIAKTENEAWSLEAGTGSLTQTGVVMGSLEYLSPEQASAAPLDRRTDIWSLGTLLYRALSGRGPHDRYRSTPRRLMALCQEPPCPIQDAARWVRRSTAALVHKALQTDPSKRYHTAEEWFDLVSTLLPEGWTIHETMLTALSEQERSHQASRLALTASGGLPASVEAICRSEAGEDKSANRGRSPARQGPTGALAQPSDDRAGDGSQGIFTRLESVYEAAARWDALLELYDARLAAAGGDGERAELHRRVARVLARKLRNPERAFQSLLQAFRLDSEDPSTIAQLESLATELDRWGDLLSAASKLLDAETDATRGSGLARQLARWLLNRGQQSQAQQCLERAQSLSACDRQAGTGVG